MHKNICAVIVTFNRLNKLKETIFNSLNEPIDDIVVVNNASTDGTKEWLDGIKKDDRLHMVHLEDNIGGAGGFHIGFEYIYKNIQTDWIVCYDDDAYPKSGAIDIFLSLELDSKISSIAAAVYATNGTINEMNRPRYNPFSDLQKFIKLLKYGKSGYYVGDNDFHRDDCIKIDASTFVGYFIRRSMLNLFGMPRKELFIYADDLIYSMQATKLGYKHLFCPKIQFVHDSDTFDGEVDVYKPMWKVYYTYRNRIEMLRLSTGFFFYPLFSIQMIKWKKQAHYYQEQKLFKKLLSIAIKDGIKRDFSKKHNEILKIVEQNRDG